MSTSMSGLKLVCLSLLLGACTSAPKSVEPLVVTKTVPIIETVYANVPGEYTEPLPIPSGSGIMTNADLARLYGQCISALQEANEDRKTVSELFSNDDG